MSILVSALGTLEVIIVVTICARACSRWVVVGTSLVGTVIVISTAVLVIAISTSLIQRFAVGQV